MFHETNNCAIVSRSGYIWIWSGARDQESTNHRVHFVEWKSSYITIVAVPLDLLPTGKWDFTHGKSVFCVWPLFPQWNCPLKSLWIHKKEQKNYPWHFPNQVVGFNLGLSTYKSSLTNRVEEKSKPGNCSTCGTCWAHFCGVALKLRQGTYQIQYSWHQTWLTFEVCSECILLVFALNTH